MISCFYSAASAMFLSEARIVFYFPDFLPLKQLVFFTKRFLKPRLPDIRSRNLISFCIKAVFWLDSGKNPRNQLITVFTDLWFKNRGQRSRVAPLLHHCWPLGFKLQRWIAAAWRNRLSALLIGRFGFPAQLHQMCSTATKELLRLQPGLGHVSANSARTSSRTDEPLYCISSKSKESGSAPGPRGPRITNPSKPTLNETPLLIALKTPRRLLIKRLCIKSTA